MKTVLIYVLSAEMHPYPLLREASVATWDSKKLEGTETLYYSASKIPSAGVMVNFDIPDGLYNMGHKDLAAYEWALANRSWDYMARVNSSCYVVKDKLLDFVQKLPDRDVVSGTLGPGPNNRNYLWGGANFVLSRDAVQNLCSNKQKWQHHEMEDVAMSYLAESLGYTLMNTGGACSVNKRPDDWLCISYHGATQGGFEFHDFSEFKEQNVCHFIRVKQDYDRSKDIYVMEQLFKNGV